MSLLKWNWTNRNFLNFYFYNDYIYFLFYLFPSSSPLQKYVNILRGDFSFVFVSFLFVSFLLFYFYLYHQLCYSLNTKIRIKDIVCAGKRFFLGGFLFLDYFHQFFKILIWLFYIVVFCRKNILLTNQFFFKLIKMKNYDFILN